MISQIVHGHLDVVFSLQYMNFWVIIINSNNSRNQSTLLYNACNYRPRLADGMDCFVRPYCISDYPRAL